MIFHLIGFCWFIYPVIGEHFLFVCVCDCWLIVTNGARIVLTGICVSYHCKISIFKLTVASAFPAIVKSTYFYFQEIKLLSNRFLLWFHSVALPKKFVSVRILTISITNPFDFLNYIINKNKFINTSNYRQFTVSFFFIITIFYLIYYSKQFPVDWLSLMNCNHDLDEKFHHQNILKLSRILFSL